MDIYIYIYSCRYIDLPASDPFGSERDEKALLSVNGRSTRRYIYIFQDMYRRRYIYIYIDVDV